MPRKSRKKRYCSRACEAKAYRARKQWRGNRRGDQAGCIICGQPMDLKKANQHTCSQRCRKRLQRCR